MSTAAATPTPTRTIHTTPTLYRIPLIGATSLNQLLLGRESVNFGILLVVEQSICRKRSRARARLCVGCFCPIRSVIPPPPPHDLYFRLNGPQKISGSEQDELTAAGFPKSLLPVDYSKAFSALQDDGDSPLDMVTALAQVQDPQQ